ELVKPGGIVIIPAVLLSACSSTSQTETATGPSTPKCGVQVSAESSSFPPAGGSASLRVTTSRECPWSAKSDAAWLTLSSPVNGEGEGSIKFTVVPNGDPSSRSASLSVNDQRVQISQEGKPCEFT